MGREHHGTNCAYRANPDEPCTCGVTERTEREMHAAWRKRAEEAETALAAMTAERDALLLDADPPVCRLQLPDGSVPTNARDAAEKWHAQSEAYRKERDAQAAALLFVGGATRWKRAHVWTETPGVEVQVFPDADVPHALRLVVRDVHAKEDLASVRVESFRLDLLCGPIVRLWLEYQAKLARAAVEGER